ncbi:hypothetical protein IJ182_03845 [bacterium]|nr:hypothetical protein [bacterium]
MKNRIWKIICNKFIYNFVTLIVITVLFSIPSYAFEDCLISSDSKLTDIRIEHNDIINVYPIYTLMNEKNTLYVQPLKQGETKFTVLKNNKERHMFSVKVEAEKTIIDNITGFDVVSIDLPPGLYEYELDEPPVKLNK